MGEVLMQPMGGGIGSDDVTAAKAHVLAGHNTVTTDSDDEVVEGTMPDRGQWQYGQSMAHVNGYYAMNQLPEGYYHSDGADWAPEVRMKDAVAKQSQMWSDAYSAGVSDADSRVNTNSASYNKFFNPPYGTTNNSYTASSTCLAVCVAECMNRNPSNNGTQYASVGINTNGSVIASWNDGTGIHDMKDTWYTSRLYVWLVKLLPGQSATMNGSTQFVKYVIYALGA